MALRDWLCASKPIATATFATSATSATSATNESREQENVAKVATVAIAKPLTQNLPNLDHG
jgi:hypothetical protein